VSTVDSGNLIASLWVLARGCQELTETRFLNSALEGLADRNRALRALTGRDPSLAAALEVLRNAVRDVPLELRNQPPALGRLLHFSTQTGETLGNRAGDEKTYWATKLASELEKLGRNHRSLSPLDGNIEFRRPMKRCLPSVRRSFSYARCVERASVVI